MRLLLVLSFLFPVLAVAGDSGDMDEIKACLRYWDSHPFKGENPKFRTMISRVKVMGIGDEVADTKKTDKPELILVKPNVTVMSKSVLRLLNPNGWYCMKGKVSVLGKSEIQIACKAKLASSNSGAVVMGDDNANTGGVTVLGETRVVRVGCADASEEKEVKKVEKKEDKKSSDDDEKGDAD